MPINSKAYENPFYTSVLGKESTTWSLVPLETSQGDNRGRIEARDWAGRTTLKQHVIGFIRTRDVEYFFNGLNILWCRMKMWNYLSVCLCYIEFELIKLNIDVHEFVSCFTH